MWQSTITMCLKILHQLGLEPSQKSTKTAEKQPIATAAQPQAQPKDHDFIRLAKAWPTLPVHIRAAVMALVKTAKGGI